ncbi:ABC transporter substrate-binding protein [Geobacter sp. SVR]|uniref:ABC transporter substrate-binding protein n=1 Tax=Geobacter sp. SVR TaxID=2495594 RepID=UPI00143EF608|nr:ABC transporter substrate-binding protein [Geobacter sp. SVR]BCS54123.1 hypothetical protein GSVR_24310 [Geobacter sp. SVR]GCF87685.1 hypothetical protein GSbR_42850 [Geobacter sp. SVR]
MNAELLHLAAMLALMAGIVLATVSDGAARTIRLGYLDHPGSALCRIAAAKGHFAKEGVAVTLVRFADSAGGLAALEAGTIDVGAFATADTLRAIAAGKGFRIVAGGGTPISTNTLAELDESIRAEEDGRGVVVLVPPSWPGSEKGLLIQLTAALIRAYRTVHNHPEVIAGIRPAQWYDPNPDYWKLERIWRLSGLQQPEMKRDFLAGHVYEEIYCDALDRLLLGPIDSALQNLFSKAVCTPNCCPANSGALFSQPPAAAAQ